MIDLKDKDERAAAAAEYVLGTLSDEDHAAFVAALAHDIDLQAQVYAWQDRLLGLSAQAAPVTPTQQLWKRIDVGLGALASAHPARPRSSGEANPWWQRLRLWQGVSAFAVGVALLLGVLLIQRLWLPDAAGEHYIAVLQSPDNQSTGWIVELRAGRSLRLTPVADMGPVPAGRALQFWTKPEGAAAPTSLGLVQAGQSIELPLSRLPAVEARQLFEITLEPEGGSPIGRPTGPILFVGRTVPL